MGVLLVGLGGRVGSEDYRQILSYALSLVLVHTQAVTVNPVATEVRNPVATEVRPLADTTFGLSILMVAYL